MTETIRCPVGPRLRELIQARGFSQDDVCHATGITKGNLSTSLAGERDLRVSTVSRILNAIGATWADLDVNSATR